MSQKCALIEAEKAHYPIMFMCRLLKVARSTYYAWVHRVETPTRARRRELAGHITAVFTEHHGRYGCRRITAELNRAGIEASIGLVADLMRSMGLRATQPRAYKRTTIPGPDPDPTPDLIDGDFTPDTTPAGQRLVGDITYLRTGQGWLYLATVIDLSTRMVIGWQLADHMRTSLVTDALQMALDTGHVRADAIFHTDRGTQYTSTAFAAFCRRHRVRLSHGRTGVCWDNAVAETFFATLKNEMYHRQHWPTKALARYRVAEYIETYYNRRRLHSSLGYRTPYEALTDHTAARAA